MEKRVKLELSELEFMQLFHNYMLGELSSDTVEEKDEAHYHATERLVNNLCGQASKAGIKGFSEIHSGVYSYDEGIEDSFTGTYHTMIDYVESGEFKTDREQQAKELERLMAEDPELQAKIMQLSKK